MLAEGRYLITSFVKIYQNKLRYFGDLRNQLVHGFRLDNQHYVLASDHAIGEVKSLYEEARSPKTAFSVFAKKVYICKTSDSLKQVISTMKKELNTHVPVYDEQGKFVDMLSESTITYWIADEIDAKGEAHLEQVTVGDVPLGNSNEYHLFVDKEKSVYEIEELFAEEHKESEGKKRLGAVFITATGSESEPIE